MEGRGVLGWGSHTAEIKMLACRPRQLLFLQSDAFDGYLLVGVLCKCCGSMSQPLLEWLRITSLVCVAACTRRTQPLKTRVVNSSVCHNKPKSFAAVAPASGLGPSAVLRRGVCRDA